MQNKEETKHGTQEKNHSQRMRTLDRTKDPKLLHSVQGKKRPPKIEKHGNTTKTYSMTWTKNESTPYKERRGWAT